MELPFRWALFPTLTASILLAGVSCGILQPGQTWQPPRPVAISGGEKWVTLSPSVMTYVPVGQDGGVGGTLLRDGDLLSSFDEVAWIVYRSSDGASLDTSVEDGRLLLSRKTVSLTLKDDTVGWEWLERASPEDLRSLRFLMMPESLDENRIPILKKLAAANPDLALGIQSILVYSSVAQFFKPRVLFLGDTTPAAELSRLLANQKQIVTLYLSEGAETFDFLADLPNLRRLIILDWDPGRTGPLPDGMRSLKSLVIGGLEITGSSALAGVPEDLEELSIVGCNSFSDPTGLERFPNLRTLILNLSPGIKDLSALRHMKKLSWAGLPPKITQDGFAEFANAHPDLKILELVSCKEITDLSPLEKLTGLTGLVLTESYENLDTVRGMKSLTFLALPMKTFAESPEKISELRAALPKAMVVPSMTMCLGSGWILIIFPLAALMWLGRTRPWRPRMNGGSTRGRA